MAYVFVLNGASLLVEGEQYGALEGLDKGVTDRVESLGLKIQSVVDSDDGYTAVMMGVELLPERHISQGVTKTMDPGLLPDGFDDLFNEVHAFLQKKYEKTYEYKKGIIVSQFD